MFAVLTLGVSFSERATHRGTVISNHGRIARGLPRQHVTDRDQTESNLSQVRFPNKTGRGWQAGRLAGGQAGRQTKSGKSGTRSINCASLGESLVNDVSFDAIEM